MRRLLFPKPSMASSIFAPSHFHYVSVPSTRLSPLFHIISFLSSATRRSFTTTSPTALNNDSKVLLKGLSYTELEASLSPFHLFVSPSSTLNALLEHIRCDRNGFNHEASDLAKP